MMIETLIELREYYGLNQSQFARLLGVAPAHYCNIENKKMKLTPAYYNKVAERLDIPVSALDVLGWKKTDVLEDKQKAFEILKPRIDEMVHELFFDSDKMKTK